MSKSSMRQRKPPVADDRTASARSLVSHLRLAVDELERLLIGSTDARPPIVEREVMKPGEYAERMRVSVAKVHRWIKKGMPHFQIEGRVRIRVAEADGWLAEHATSVEDTPDSDA